MKFARSIQPFLLLAFTIFSEARYNTDVCCELARIGQNFIGDVPPLDNQTCGQTYSVDLPAAIPLHVDYAFCSSRCGGMGRSNFSKPSEWAAPIVQFLLPSVIFSMGIPREKVIDIDYTQMIISKLKIENSFLQMLVFLIGFLIVLFPVLMDSVFWIITVVIGAGNMIVGGLYEAVIDYRIVKYLHTLDNSNLAVKRELLATLASGNLRLSPPSPDDPKTKILNSLQPPDADPEKSRSRLLNLIGAQSSFGGAVGSPVLFYLGAFVYTILDLHNNPSDQDNAISLGFGIEWMIIPHVNIISGTLLAANNPSTSSGIVGSKHEAMDRRPNGGRRAARTREGWVQWLGWSKSYETEFQPVSIWGRGANKMKWIQDTEAWKNEQSAGNFRNVMHFSGLNWLYIFIAAFLLIVIPPAAGGLVAYATPPKGIACRSLSFVIYGSSQFFITILATLQAMRPHWKWMKGKRFIVLSIFWWFCSLIAAIGGTVMQISGVYKNCVCYAGAENWVNIAKKNPSIQVANDTEVARQASKYWIWMGVFATLFMAFNCYIGWWYQMFIRRKFTEAVENMFVPIEPIAVIDGVEPPEVPNPIVPDPVVAGPVVPPPTQEPDPVKKQSSWGLPHLAGGQSFELSFVNTRLSDEDAPLIVHGGDVEGDEPRESDIGSRPSADYERDHSQSRH